MARNIRQKALEQIAALSATSTSSSFDKSDLERLCKAAPSSSKQRENPNGFNSTTKHGIGREPMV